jgi:queuine tRNA-ribosyltransferase
MTNFKIIKSCPETRARLGKLFTPHGVVTTPAFIPVGSLGVVKTLTPEELKDIGVELVLGNTFHLYLRPGVEIITKFGGLHRFMGWQGPIMTDSGGYQVFSLAKLRKVTDEGVVFQSPIDGSEHLFTPELAMEVQETLGADIIMTFDHPPAYGEEWEGVKQATERTNRWAERCLKAQRKEQALFAIIQGGTFPQLRKEATLFLTSLDFPGYALGGLSLGEPRDITRQMVKLTIDLLAQGKPRHLMGVGSPEELIEGVALGIDLFDSALPTRVARNGALFTSSGRKNLTHSQFKEASGPVEEGCPCYTCKNFSIAYLHHLFKVEEMLAPRLATIHNLTFIMRLIKEIQQAILEERFNEFRQEFLAHYRPTNEGLRLAQKQKWLKKWILTPSDSRDDTDLIPRVKGGR